tara:strand:+ start:1273 stop:1776 length:504 start_codon:yes stop_codon:yes gene_type:complete
MKKTKKHAFNKDVYLLGKDKEGVYYWLEQPKWDCDWYWGFGYIETYTHNKQPQLATDINSHEHATNFMSEFFTEWNGTEPRLVETPYSEKEGWELCELLKRFYILNETAQMYSRGGAHVSKSVLESIRYNREHDKEEAEHINKRLIPKVTDRILEILTPIDQKQQGA